MSVNYIQAKGIPSRTIKFEYPSDANAIILDTNDDLIYDLTNIPQSVEHIQFGSNFDQLINKDILPIGLKSIKFGSLFNQPIEKDVLSLFYCSFATIK